MSILSSPVGLLSLGRGLKNADLMLRAWMLSDHHGGFLPVLADEQLANSPVSSCEIEGSMTSMLTSTAALV